MYWTNMCSYDRQITKGKKLMLALCNEAPCLHAWKNACIISVGLSVGMMLSHMQILVLYKSFRGKIFLFGLQTLRVRVCAHQGGGQT